MWRNPDRSHNRLENYKTFRKYRFIKDTQFVPSERKNSLRLGENTGIGEVSKFDELVKSHKIAF
jgi:hypothetical protein